MINTKKFCQIHLPHLTYGECVTLADRFKEEGYRCSIGINIYQGCTCYVIVERKHRDLFKKYAQELKPDYETEE